MLIIPTFTNAISTSLRLSPDEGLSVEQLESAGGELQTLCSLLQAELDLYTRYLSSQVQDEAQQATHTAAGTSGEEGRGEGGGR